MDKVNSPFLPELAKISPRKPRYKLNPESLEKLGKLKSLCSNSIQPTGDWRSAVMAVSASSTIEDEGLPDELVNRLIAMTEPGEHVDSELSLRLASQQDIAQAYLWLLRLKTEPNNLITKSIVLATHRKMFLRTKKDIAGVYKQKKVIIRWHKPDGIIEKVPTLPEAKVDIFLDGLCNLTCQAFSEEPIGNLLVAAEFSCDFLAIHPFSDGNGRLARMLCGYLLQQTGYNLIGEYPLEQIILETRHQYYESLNKSQSYWRRQREDLSPWMEYFIECLFEHSHRAMRAKKIR